MLKTRTKIAEKYRPFQSVAMTERLWPQQRITRAPIWCSVDLRDGNQALVEPMNAEKKLRMWQVLVGMGYKEIEVGFPSASQTDFDFIRHIIEHDAIPADVTIQVLTQCRDSLIDRTFEAIRGARRVIVHIYNSTSPQQREYVFQTDQQGITQIAVQGARKVRAHAEELHRRGETQVLFQYSPESFSQTEHDFALTICEKVLDEFNATPQRRVILNLPATVEVSTPNTYADQIELFCRKLKGRDRAIISVHPHNDRGTAVAAAELALMAGAERVEGTLFGNGERTGNVDLVTLGMNLFSQGIDPGIDFSNMQRLVDASEYCTKMPVGSRHPYAGTLVFTAFSGSHQDAIRKSLKGRKEKGKEMWDIPYLPIDPEDVGGCYEEIIRINSQSGKGGVAFVMETDHGLHLPRALQIALSRMVQAHTDQHGAEISSIQIYEIFQREFVQNNHPLKFIEYQTIETEKKKRRLVARLLRDGREISVTAEGNGPVDAFFNAITPLIRDLTGGRSLKLKDYAEHARIDAHHAAGSQATAAAYVSVVNDNDQEFYGAGINPSIVEASLEALIAAINNALAGTHPQKTLEE